MSINNMTSIFRVEEIRSYDSEEHWYREACIGIVGHYSSLEKTLEAIRTNNHETWDAEEIMAYLVKEIPVDSIWGEVDCLSIRSFNAQGDLIDQCLQDYNLCNQFEGRYSEAIRFKIGDIVEVLEGRRLYTAIVAALPPTPENHFPILDALDDCYLVLPLDSGHIAHLHVPPTHTFTLQHPIGKNVWIIFATACLFIKTARMRLLCIASVKSRGINTFIIMLVYRPRSAFAVVAIRSGGPTIVVT